MGEYESNKWFYPGLNRGPSLRKSDVITNYTMKPTHIKVRKSEKGHIGYKVEDDISYSV